MPVVTRRVDWPSVLLAGQQPENDVVSGASPKHQHVLTVKAPVFSSNAGWPPQNFPRRRHLSKRCLSLARIQRSLRQKKIAVVTRVVQGELVGDGVALTLAIPPHPLPSPILGVGYVDEV